MIHSSLITIYNFLLHRSIDLVLIMMIAQSQSLNNNAILIQFWYFILEVVRTNVHLCTSHGAIELMRCLTMETSSCREVYNERESSGNLTSPSHAVGPM